VTIDEVDVAETPDSTIVDLFHGDFDTFFERHHADMVRALSLALGDPDLGRDAAAEGFVRALQRWSTVSEPLEPRRLGVPGGAQLGPVAFPQDAA
jgi:hypothetical protein